jgi:hypothetical protein
MRAKLGVLALTALVILGLSVSPALAVNSVKYLGKTTWTVTITDDSNPQKIGISFTVTGGISKVGDEFYQFQGYVTMDGDGPFVIGGSGVMIGNNLVFTLSESQQHPDTWRDSGVMHVTIDASTQNGTFYDIGHDFDISARTFDQRFTAGNLTLKGSPIPMGVALPQLDLLLQ